MVVFVKVSPAGRAPAVAPRLPITLEFPVPSVSHITVNQVKDALTKKFPKLYKSRQKLTLKGEHKALPDEAALSTVDAVVGPEGVELTLKDLGPQISWRTVFMVEYVGPLIIHPLIYHLPQVFYRGAVHHSMLQKYVYAMVLLHFAKRELETLFVHRFSHSTMPAFNIIKNSAHYHILGGLLLAYVVYGPAYGSTSPYIRGTIRDDPRFLWACAAVFTFAELSNLKTHIATRLLRPAGTRTRGIPRGYGFDLVSSPNYTFEIIAWTAVAVMTGSWAAWVFTVVSAGQMIIWALKKHANYKKEFGKEYPRSRKAIFPFVL